AERFDPGAHPRDLPAAEEFLRAELHANRVDHADVPDGWLGFPTAGGVVHGPQSKALLAGGRNVTDVVRVGPAGDCAELLSGAARGRGHWPGFGGFPSRIVADGPPGLG